MKTILMLLCLSVSVGCADIADSSGINGGIINGVAVTPPFRELNIPASSAIKIAKVCLDGAYWYILTHGSSVVGFEQVFNGTVTLRCNN